MDEVGLQGLELSSHLVWGGNDLRPGILRQLLGSYPTGVAVVTTRAADGRQVGLTINSFASLSLSPPLVLWSLGNRSTNHAVFRDCTHFAINMLGDRQEAIARRFANSNLPDKFGGVAVHQTPEGIPIIDDALTVLMCVHDHCRTVGDHLLLIGRVVRTSSCPGEPLVFHGGRFGSLARAESGAESKPLAAGRRNRENAAAADEASASAAWSALMESEPGV